MSLLGRPARRVTVTSPCKAMPFGLGSEKGGDIRPKECISLFFQR